MKKWMLVAFIAIMAVDTFGARVWFKRSTHEECWIGSPSFVYITTADGRNVKILEPSESYLTADGWEFLDYECPNTDLVGPNWGAEQVYRPMTGQEYIDRAAAREAAEQAAADAEAAAALLPVPFASGVEVPRIVWQSLTNGWGYATELVDGGSATNEPETITYLFHASPVNWATVNSNRTKALVKLADKKVKKSSLLNAKNFGEFYPAFKNWVVSQ